MGQLHKLKVDEAMLRATKIGITVRSRGPEKPGGFWSYACGALDCGETLLWENCFCPSGPFSIFHLIVKQFERRPATKPQSKADRLR